MTRQRLILRAAQLAMMAAAAAAVVLIGLELAEQDGSDDSAAGRSESARIETIPGAGTSRIVLTAKAYDRLGIRTVRLQTDAAHRLIAPLSAVLFDTQGNAWVYRSPRVQTFVRTAVEVESAEGDRAVFAAGPPAGTVVVSVGAPELDGVESGIDH